MTCSKLKFKLHQFYPPVGSVASEGVLSEGYPPVGSGATKGVLSEGYPPVGIGATKGVLSEGYMNSCLCGSGLACKTGMSHPFPTNMAALSRALHSF